MSKTQLERTQIKAARDDFRSRFKVPLTEKELADLDLAQVPDKPGVVLSRSDLARLSRALDKGELDLSEIRDSVWRDVICSALSPMSPRRTRLRAADLIVRRTDPINAPPQQAQITEVSINLVAPQKTELPAPVNGRVLRDGNGLQIRLG